MSVSRSGVISHRNVRNAVSCLGTVPIANDNAQRMNSNVIVTGRTTPGSVSKAGLYRFPSCLDEAVCCTHALILFVKEHAAVHRFPAPHSRMRYELSQGMVGTDRCVSRYHWVQLIALP